ncbi:MAG TPA: PDZ domain-containing protein [Candidatus Polarisedimenticolia bacterium]|nr:PDZ domain-containing protein [Candidatus Polarisedimenticolia bacterium]
MKKSWLGFVALACVAVLATGAVLAGGAECHGKSAEAANAKGECNMSAEECAAHMQKEMATRGWLGIEKEKGADGTMTISKIYPGSPAEQAGFQVGDKLVSMNGVELASASEKAWKNMKNAKIGDTATYVVNRGSENLTIKATLVKIPDDVLAASIDKHVKEDHAAMKN